MHVSSMYGVLSDYQVTIMIKIVSNFLFSNYHFAKGFFVCSSVHAQTFTNRSSHRRCSVKKVVLKNFAILKEPPTQVFPVKLANFYKNSYLEEYLRWLLLNKLEPKLKPNQKPPLQHKLYTLNQRAFIYFLVSDISLK